MPSVIKFFLTRNCVATEAIVIGSKDLSKILLFPRGGAGLSSSYEAELEYIVKGRQYKAVVRRTEPFLDKAILYYKPNNPCYYTLSKKLGIHGWIFIIVALLFLGSNYYQ